MGQEPIGRPVHARQPPIARHRHQQFRRAPGGAGAGQRLRIQRVPRPGHLSRAEGVQLAGRRAAHGDSRPGDSIELQLPDARGARGARLAPDAVVQHVGALLVPAHEALRPGVHARRGPGADRPALSAGAHLEVLALADPRQPRRSARSREGDALRRQQRPRRPQHRLGGRVREDVRAGVPLRAPARAPQDRAGAGHARRRRARLHAHGGDRQSRRLGHAEYRRGQPARERALLRRRRHHRPRLLARPPRHREDDYGHRVPDRRQQARSW